MASELPANLIQKRLSLAQLLSSLPGSQFEQAIFTLKVPMGNIPSAAAAQAQRAAALLERVESPIGCGLESLKTVFDAVIDAATASPESGGADDTADSGKALIGSLSVNVPSLPPHYLPRKEDFEALKAKVLAPTGQAVAITGTRKSVSIHGMGGLDKSVLAAALARDEEVRKGSLDRGCGCLWAKDTVSVVHFFRLMSL